MEKGYQEITPVEVHPNYKVSSVLKETIDEGEKITFFSQVETSEYPVEYDNIKILKSKTGQVVLETLCGSSRKTLDTKGMAFDEVIQKFEQHIDSIIVSQKMDFYNVVQSFEV